MRLYRTRDFPTQLSVPCDYILRARAASVGDHMVHIFNLDADKISFARATPTHLFDDQKIRDSGVYADRHNLGGAGFYCGKQDVVCSFHLNRERLGNPKISALELFRTCAGKVCRAINSLGLSVSVKKEIGQNVRDGVCVNLEGRSEIVTSEGTKLAGGVFRDDGLIFTAYEIILVSDAWASIYEYIKETPPKGNVTSLQSLKPGITTGLVADLVTRELGEHETGVFSANDFRSMERLAPQFGYDQWQA